MTLVGPPPSPDKARGAYYTPASIATFLTRWAIRSADDRVLEPSAGDGAFVAAIVDRYESLGLGDLSRGLVAVERESREAAKIRAFAPNITVLESDFFDLTPASHQRFDVVLGNPPFIRFHAFTGSDRAKGLRRAREQGVALSELASSWAHFVAHAVGFLGPDGRLALVLPAELLHADYAHPIRQLLSARFHSVTVIAFDHQVFPEAQVDAVLLLASSEGDAGYRIVRARDGGSLAALDIESMGPSGSNGPARDQPTRWSAALEPSAALVYEHLAASASFGRLGTFASVDIGFVSGADDFFVPTREHALRLGLPDHVLRPAIRRPGDVRGLVVRPEETSVLFRPVDIDVLADPSIGAYIDLGVQNGVSGRYKCRVRRPWYVVPLPRTQPDAFLPYMNHRAPRLIVNSTGAWSANLLHGVRLRDRHGDIRVMAAAMTSSATLLSAEIEGRSYGGGVLKLETREAERLLVATPGSLVRDALITATPSLDKLVRQGDVEGAAQVTDEILGLDHDLIWTAYLAYRSRRLGRRKVRVG